MNKRASLATIGVATMIALAIPGIAAAHNATANGTCQGGVTWSATNYQKELVNSITVRVDGVIVHQDLDFKASDTGSHATDKTVGHVWSVDIDAPGTQYDRHLQGMYEACVVPTSTTVVVTTSAPTATTVPTTSPTTVVTDPTTTVVAVDIPPVSTTVAPADVVVLTPVEPALPRTGADLFSVVISSILVGFGAAAVVIARRRVG